ncbi:MAG: hypothetical protein JWO37_948 [Acidimicrobiales bacterium]|jgi:hypothetical protein|nr:hypothetical protein [Acidimicrobiales bacterium]
MMGTNDLLREEDVADGDELLVAVRHGLQLLQDARLLRTLSRNEFTEHDELLGLEEHLLRRRL